MDKDDFIELSRKILIDVMELDPEKKNAGGLSIYVARDNSFAIPIIMSESELKKWLGIVRINWKSWADIMDGKLGMISDRIIRYSSDNGYSEDFKLTAIFTANNFENHIGFVKRDFQKLKLKARMGNLLEAYVVAYVCHEIRHMIQMKMLAIEEYFSCYDTRPEFSNPLIAHEKLRKYCFRETKYQMGLYKKHYTKSVSIKKALAMEKDASYIQWLAFDCWINPNTGYEEKIKNLQKILRTKK
ncbi:MAG: hypothetical protein ACD_15C00111G0005 [uncultured bacterium]|nr:MAG: hypothetical protein ACD_15C00111G0005 [uncultured bacterium]